MVVFVEEVIGKDIDISFIDLKTVFAEGIKIVFVSVDVVVEIKVRNYLDDQFVDVNGVFVG